MFSTPKLDDCHGAWYVRVNSTNIMSENGTIVVGSVPARDGRIKVVLSESKSSSLLGEKTACGVKDDVKAAPKPAVDTAKPDGDVDEIYLSSPPSHLGAEACGIKSAAAEELAAKSAAAEEDAESATEEATAEEAATKKATTEEAAAKSATEEESEEAATEEAAAEESATEEAVVAEESATEEAVVAEESATNVWAGKITGMFLENDIQDLQEMLCVSDNSKAAALLVERVWQALGVLAQAFSLESPCYQDDETPASAKTFPEETASAGIDEWTTPSPLRKIERKGEPSLVDCSKNTTPMDPPTAPNGVTKSAPALTPAATGGAPLPSSEEFPGDADWTVSAKEFPGGISDRTTPSNPRRKKGRKGASAPIVRTKNTTPVGGSNRFGALLGTDGNEGILGGTGKVPRGSTPPTRDSGATVDVETTTVTTPEGSAAGRFSWPKSYNLLRLFGILALICLGAAFAHSSYSATSALLSSQRHDSPWPTSPPATVAKPFTPASPNGFCEVGGNDTSSFAAIVSSDSAPANHPGGHEDGSSWGALMEAIKEAVGEPLHLIGEPPASVKDFYEKQPGGADLETVPASRNSMERKGEPEIDLVGPVYSSRSGIIVRETVLPVNGTEMRSADAGNTPEKLVETGLGAPVSSMHAGGEWRVNRLATASPATTKDLFLQLGRAIGPLLAEPAWPAEVRAAQISDSNSVQSDISSVSRVCADRQPRCAAPVAWHAEPHHALTDERSKTDKPPANPPVDKLLSIDLPCPFHFPFMSGPSSSAPVRTQQRCQFWAALFLLLGACGGVLLSVRRSSSGRLVRCRTGARRGAWLLILAALLPLACAPSDHTSGSGDFQVTVGGGSYPSEVSWDLTCSGALIGSGGAPYSGTLSAPPGECTLDMYDSWGDGWNGNEWEGAGYTFTLGSGSYGSETACRTPAAPHGSGAGDGEGHGLPHPALSSQPQHGGVVYASRSGAVSIIGSDVSDCSADNGGVVYAWSSGTVSIIGSTVSGCSAGLYGGVVRATSSESLSIAGVDFIDNSADTSGSVLYLDKTHPSISAASFTGNTAGDDNDGATIQTDKPIDWDCRLGSWMPRKGSFFGDFS
ncbi:hypothetical protein EMIHUDRAFT_215094, partial [Emiliania huxleyi CCMP1516]|uniref:Right handed beta helix domain-containing protein n=2 Tax=Emiliania huxleyi TaxID=2903 RepID=A0A0D3IHW8_EMIH1